MNVKLTLYNKNKLVTKKDERKGYNVISDHCKFTGHSRDKCFVLHSYSEWHKLYGQPKPKLRQSNVKKTTANAVIIFELSFESKKSDIPSMQASASGPNQLS